MKPVLNTALVYRALAYGCTTASDLARYIKRSTNV